MTAGNLASLRQTFASDEWPTFEGLTRGEQTSTVILEVPASLYWFRGHFPEQAVLPGVVQTFSRIKMGPTIRVLNHYWGIELCCGLQDTVNATGADYIYGRQCELFLLCVIKQFTNFITSENSSSKF